MSNAWLEDELGQRYNAPMGGGYPVVIGRGASHKAAGRPFIEIPQNELTMKVSREHAHLWNSDEDGWQISDAGSRFGVTVDGDKLESEDDKRALVHGTKVELGAYALTFQIEDIISDEIDFDAPTMGNVEIDDQPVTLVMSPEQIREHVEPEPLDDGMMTQALPDFAPSVPPDFDGVAGAVYHLDAWIDERQESLEITPAPDCSQWTIGRDKRRGVDSEGVGHVTVPNLPEYRSVSRKHVMLIRLDDAWRLKNLSSQGSYVNDRKLAGDDETALEDGDRLILGSAVFFFRLSDDIPERTVTNYDSAVALQALGVEQPAAKRKRAKLGDDPDATRELPVGYFQQRDDIGEGNAWGQLVENTHQSPRRFPLSQRVIKIGSHPINCDVQMEDPGIGDLYAILRWHGPDIKIHSRSAESPVRVNHVSYRTSSPLKDGDILTLGNREFRLQIMGEPPDMLTYQARQRLRRTVLFAVIALNVLFFGAFFGLQAIQPPLTELKEEKPVEWWDVVSSVIGTSGLAGLPGLNKSLNMRLADLREDRELTARILDETERDVALKKIDDEEGEIKARLEDIAKIRIIAEADHVIRKASDEDFRNLTPQLESQLNTGLLALKSVHPTPSKADQGWYKDIADAFATRKDSAFATQWAKVLDEIRANNPDGAKKEIGRLSQTGFRAERINDANAILSLWKALGEDVRRVSLDNVMLGYEKGCDMVKSRQYLAEQHAAATKLINRFNDITNRGTDPAGALAESERWSDYRGRTTRYGNLISLLSFYQAGDIEPFNQHYEVLKTEYESPTLVAMKRSLDRWQDWNTRYAAMTDPLSDYRLVADLQTLADEVANTLDADCKLIRSMRQRIGELSKGRTSHAMALRVEAEALPEGHAQILKYLEAIEFDPSEAQNKKLQSMIIGYLGDVSGRGAEGMRTEKDNLCAMLGECERLIAKKVFADNYTPKRQIQALMDRANITCD